MATSAANKKVTDLTTEELREIIRETIHEFVDPDYGLELRPEVEKSLRQSVRDKHAGKGMPLSEAKRKLGLS
ncbi:MAG: hypothetical protein WCO26_20490 [Deltaproteobacteria bacterium]